MEMLKKRLHEIVDDCPDIVDIDEFVERVYLMRKIEIAERAIERGEVVSHEEVEREFNDGATDLDDSRSRRRAKNSRSHRA
jgi:hypothetical protein